MANHKFRVGQIVAILPAPEEGAPASPGFKVLQLLRQEAGQCAYRIKTITESLARVVRESEIDAGV